MTSKTSSRIFRDDLSSLFKAYKGQIVRVAILSAFLFFLLHVLMGVSFYGNSLNEGIKNKLGMYFYIKDSPEEEDYIYKQVMTLKEKLQKSWIKASFSSKEDAVTFLEKRLPNLTGTFARFWIKNPLPATLYVTLKDKEQYEVLQKIMLENKSIILNIQDLSQVQDLWSQEKRIINIIRLSNFVQIICWIFIGVVGWVILSFVIFFLKGLFNTFKKDIQVKKLLWATASQVIQPFIWTILFSLIIGFLVSLLLTGGAFVTFDYYMAQVFRVTLIPYLLEHRINVALLLAIELGVFSLLSMTIGYRYIYRLHKQLR